MHRLELLVECRLQNNCTVCSMYVILTLLSELIQVYASEAHTLPSGGGLHLGVFYYCGHTASN